MTPPIDVLEVAARLYAKARSGVISTMVLPVGPEADVAYQRASALASIAYHDMRVVHRVADDISLAIYAP